jgi:hypothetical protein
MDDLVTAAEVLTEFVNLGMAIVTSGHAVIGAGGPDLIVFEPAVRQPGILIARLEESAAAAAAVIVRSVGVHLDEIFFPHHRFHNKPEVFCNRIPKGFADDLTRILNRKLDLEVLIPVGVDLQFSLPDPFGIIFVDIFYLKGVFDIELFQSCQD